MAVKVRELPPEEWPKLLELPFGERGLPPENAARIVVAEDDDAIVGVWCFMLATFMEGMWVDPDYRKGITTGRLVQRTLQIMADAGVPQALTLVQDATVQALAEKAGFYPVEGQMMAITFEERQ